METELSLQEIKKEWHGSLRAYMTGLIASLLLTGVSFSLVAAKAFEGWTLICIIVALALVQAIVQLIYFLHLGKEDKPRWETLIFFFMLSMLLIIVIGSLWIMYNLNSRVMSGMTSMKEMTHD